MSKSKRPSSPEDIVDLYRPGIMKKSQVPAMGRLSWRLDLGARGRSERSDVQMRKCQVQV